jgi:hypothetical protein
MKFDREFHPLSKQCQFFQFVNFPLAQQTSFVIYFTICGFARSFETIFPRRIKALAEKTCGREVDTSRLEEDKRERISTLVTKR